MTSFAALDGVPSATPGEASGPQTAQGSGFRPVTGGEEMQSGERLLVEAYAAIWLIMLGFVLLMWRRNRAVEARVAALDLAVSRARSSDGAAPAKKKSAAAGSRTGDEPEATEG